MKIGDLISIVEMLQFDEIEIDRHYFTINFQLNCKYDYN
jgi:hypothetical protein